MDAPTMTAAAAPLPEPAAFAARLAEEAGAVALRWFRQPLEVELKGDESPVTAADRAVETHLRAALEARFPEHGILGEEFAPVRPEADSVWVIDPIDGTRSFITGWPIWGTLLALTVAGRAVLGVVEMPALGERWVGVAGGGAWYSAHGAPWRRCAARACDRLAAARFYTTSLLYFDGAERRRIEAVAAACHTPRFGGDCYGYGLLADGHIDLVIENRLQPYDYLAIIPVVEEAGGVITDWQGRPLTMASDGRVIAAATPGLHAEALALLAAGD